MCDVCGGPRTEGYTSGTCHNCQILIILGAVEVE